MTFLLAAPIPDARRPASAVLGFVPQLNLRRNRRAGRPRTQAAHLTSAFCRESREVQIEFQAELDDLARTRQHPSLAFQQVERD